MLVDLMNTAVWQNYMIASALGVKKQAFRKPPKPLPRPQDQYKKKTKQFAEKADFERMLGNLNAI